MAGFIMKIEKYSLENICSTNIKMSSDGEILFNIMWNCHHFPCEASPVHGPLFQLQGNIS